jgi:hypothetical protein
VSDQPDETDGTAEEAADQPLTAWPEPADGPAWSEIEDRAEPAAPGPAGPGASPEAAEEAPTEAEAGAPEAPTDAGAGEPEAPADVAPEVEPATEAGRSRRPTSLRDRYVQSDDTVPRRTLAPPPFPSAPSFPGSPVTPPVSEPPQPDDAARVSEPAPAHEPGPSLKQRLDKLPLDKLPTDKLSTDKLPVDKLRTLTTRRPEVGLGLAFAGGLVIATIIKRLGRR